MESKKIDTNELLYETDPQMQKTNMVTRGKREGRINWEIGNDIYILPYIK